METFIDLHVYTGFLLLALAAAAARYPRVALKTWQKVIVGSFFVFVLILGFGGLAIGVYRHPTSISIFQVVTTVGIIFASLGLLALTGKIGHDKKSTHNWYMNGLGGSLIATTSASLFFLALQFFPAFYKAHIIWFAIVFVAVPIMLGRRFIKKFTL